MKFLSVIFLFCIFFSSCIKNHKQQISESNLFGNWIPVVSENKTNDYVTYVIPSNYSAGFTFYQNNIFDNRYGYYKDTTQHGTRVAIFLGTSSKYKIKGDSIHFFNPENNNWDNFKIFKLTADSFKFGANGWINVYKHLYIEKNKTPSFDEIVFSKSPCFLPCQVINIIVKSDGNVLFEGQDITKKYDLSEGSISKKYFLKLQDNFRKQDFDSLKNNYASGVTDLQTTSITFIKNGKIIKTVEDYGWVSPILFKWAYVPLENLYQKIKLKKADNRNFLKNAALILDSRFIKEDSVLQLKQSETFLLLNYLRQGKMVKNNFKPRFKLHLYRTINSLGEMNTDGRYYRFSAENELITIDIGFNFYDINSKIWQWRKANEYDY